MPRQFCRKLSYNTTKMYENIRKVASQLYLVLQHFDGRLFPSSKESVSDEERRVRPTTTKTFKNISRVEQVLKRDCRVSCRVIWESTGILKTIIVQHILKDDLKKRIAYEPLTKQESVARVRPKSQCVKKLCYHKQKMKTVPRSCFSIVKEWYTKNLLQNPKWSLKTFT